MRFAVVCRPLMLLLALAAPVAAEDDRVADLERKVEILTQEIEQMRLGTAADTAGLIATRGLGPAASRIYGIARGVSIGGYGEMLYENFDREREDDAASGRLDRLDYLRQVLYVGYKFSDDLLFNSEIEFEHGGVQDEAGVSGEADPVTGEVQGEAELSGEVVLEFAYVEWAWTPAFGARAGLLLIPAGLVNELHEPPIFIGARRPEVEQRILPTTWRANGIGLFGDVAGGWSYRLYLTEGLDASRFSSAGIRSGRQSGSRSLITRPAITARLDYAGVEGLVVGGSIHHGDTWQRFQPPGFDLTPRLTLAEAHGLWQWSGIEARALYARGTLADAGDLSDALGRTGGARLGEAFHGGYAEIACDVLPWWRPETRFALLPYVRWEAYDTQEDVPGGVEDPAQEISVLTAGAAFRPHPSVVLKADRQLRTNAAETATSQWNLALGYMF